ncbi:hypothetical protein FQA39_LY12096 [Lamprigera yunnana]|nr:hypothetical protein FQA39_LY12096 [Lamprigera yunnana]
MSSRGNLLGKISLNAINNDVTDEPIPGTSAGLTAATVKDQHGGRRRRLDYSKLFDQAFYLLHDEDKDFSARSRDDYSPEKGTSDSSIQNLSDYDHDATLGLVEEKELSFVNVFVDILLNELRGRVFGENFRTDLIL